jgi:hypothetical protein
LLARDLFRKLVPTFRDRARPGRRPDDRSMVDAPVHVNPFTERAAAPAKNKASAAGQSLITKYERAALHYLFLRVCTLPDYFFAV